MSARTRPRRRPNAPVRDRNLRAALPTARRRRQPATSPSSALCFPHRRTRLRHRVGWVHAPGACKLAVGAGRAAQAVSIRRYDESRNDASARSLPSPPPIGQATSGAEDGDGRAATHTAFGPRKYGPRAAVAATVLTTCFSLVMTTPGLTRSLRFLCESSCVHRLAKRCQQ